MLPLSAQSSGCLHEHDEEASPTEPDEAPPTEPEEEDGGDEAGDEGDEGDEAGQTEAEEDDQDNEVLLVGGVNDTGKGCDAGGIQAEQA